MSTQTSAPISLRQRFLPVTAAGYCRILADAVVLFLSLMVATLFRLAWMIGRDHIEPLDALHRSFQVLGTITVIIIPIGLVTFSLFGFYTHARAYELRYKALILFKGVSIAFLTAALVMLLVRDQWGTSRSVLVIGYCIANPALILIRMGSQLWRRLTSAEQHHRTPEEHPRRSQRVLVIGGAGYIGSALIPKLLAEGYAVRIFDRMIYGDHAIHEFLTDPRVQVVRADFRQVDAVVQAMQDVDIVVHLGAIVGDPACALNESLTTDINLMATRMIAEVAKGLGIQRFVFASTCSVYGASDELLDERSRLNPVSLYAKTKIACERVLLKMTDSTFSPCILRFATIYGLSGRTRFDLVINLLTAKANFDGEITVSGGDQWRPFVHVADAALGIMKAIQAPTHLVSGQIFNLGGNSENYTINQAAELIQQVVPTAHLKDIPFDGDRRNYRVRFDKAERDLQFHPTWNLEGGIRQVDEAIKSGRIKSYRDPQYSNVNFLKANGVVESLDLGDQTNDIDALIAAEQQDFVNQAHS